MKSQTGLTFVVGAVVGAVVRQLITRPPFDEERPAMIIKNGSITFENEGKKVGWDGDTDYFYPNQPGGRKVTSLVAEATNADGGTTVMKGEELIVTYTPDTGVPQDFEVQVKDNQPKIKHQDKLCHDNGKKELRFGEKGNGRISKVVLGGTTCTFSKANGLIKIWYL